MKYKSGLYYISHIILEKQLPNTDTSCLQSSKYVTGAGIT